MITQFKNAREASASMYKLEPPATAVSRQFAPHFRYCQRSEIVAAQLEEFTQYFAHYALMVWPEGRISAVSHLFPVTVN